MKIVVFGAGLVGSAIIKDLAQEETYHITVADINPGALDQFAGFPNVTPRQADIAESGVISDLVGGADLAVSAVPGFMGFQTLNQIIQGGKDVVDISFFPEDPFDLDGLARDHGVTAVVDCGVAPGLCNIIAGYVDGKLDRTEYYHCYVGGLPQIRKWPYEYKAVFSPADVLEEYTRPARFLEQGREVVYPALSGLELIDFPPLGTLEAFNTDGLRTLRVTLSIPTMKEKTLRYPGHANLMRVFRESGFFSPEPVAVSGVEVSPLALTSRLLFDQWKMREGDRDLTVMQVLLSGQEGEAQVTYRYDLLDYYDEQQGISSMARTTGYTCAIVARKLLQGKFSHPGICPPELIGQQAGLFKDLLSEYDRRGIKLQETITRD